MHDGAGMLSSDRLPRRRPPASPDRVQSQFLAGRTACLDRLVRAGIQRSLAQRWIDAWDVSTAELADFREATDFWTVGFSYAVEEYRRGYLPPATTPVRGPTTTETSKARPRPAVAAGLASTT